MNNLVLVGAISFCYLELATINVELSKKQSSIEQMIDKATGAGAETYKKQYRRIRYLLICICRYKRQLGEDYSGDYKMLQTVKLFTGNNINMIIAQVKHESTMLTSDKKQEQ